MALANIAFRLANTHALRVLAVDWDLEAPGLHEFFGLSAEEMSKARGVLDFLLEWRDAIKSNAAAPPDVRSWFLPVTKQPYAPRHGSLALLPAGRMDEDYNTRLGRFSWRLFYKRHRGGVAIETLREQLVESADIVLIDSRTGLTDAGGICTIQLPDSVVLMSAPNEQSLLGTEQVARGILNAAESSRAGRPTPTMWFSLSRISIVEETIGATKWIEAHEKWFESRVKEGLWRAGDHPNGLASHLIPFRARWSFGEQLLSETASSISDDPLPEAFERMTTVLLGWTTDASAMEVEVRATRDRTSSPESTEILRQRAAEAETRGDIPRLHSALLDLGQALGQQKRYDEAVEILERAAGIDLARGERVSYAYTLKAIAEIRTFQERYDDAQALHERALAIFREHGKRPAGEMVELYRIGELEFKQRRFADAQAHYEQALALGTNAGLFLMQRATIRSALGRLHREQGQLTEAIANHRTAFEMFRDLGLRLGQISQLKSLGDLYREQQDLAQALAAYSHARTIAKDHKDNRWEGILVECIASLHEAAGRFTEAEAQYKDALGLFNNVNDLAAISRIQKTIKSFRRKSS
jgi:tetratricopeptide (TPR) repeat protein